MTPNVRELPDFCVFPTCEYWQSGHAVAGRLCYRHRLRFAEWLLDRITVADYQVETYVEWAGQEV